MSRLETVGLERSLSVTEAFELVTAAISTEREAIFLSIIGFSNI